MMSFEKGISQQLVHFQFKPTSYSVLDPMFSFEEFDRDEVISSIAGFDSMDVFITSKYFASKAYNSAGWVHTTYNRKTRIMRRHIKYGDKEFFSEDSIMFYLHIDKELRQKSERIKDTLHIREYPENQKTIHGIKCHLITFPAYGWLSSQLDSVWVADFKNLPGLTSPFWFLTQGVALERVNNDGLVSVHVSSEKRKAPNPSNDIFTIDPQESELHQLQSQNRIADVVNFILAFKASLP